MKTKEFSLGSIINMADGTLVTTMEDVYEIASFICGDSLFTHALPRAFKYCSPELKRQLPFLASPAFQSDLSELRTTLENNKQKENRDVIHELISGWLLRMEERYGKTHPVNSAEGGWLSRDPIEEAESVFGKGKVVVVKT